VEGIVSNTLAARAALLAYAAACRTGAATPVAVDVALARYRSSFPLATERRVRGILAHALAIERLKARGFMISPGRMPVRVVMHRDGLVAVETATTTATAAAEH
jgi:hypothetical protein